MAAQQPIDRHTEQFRQRAKQADIGSVLAAFPLRDGLGLICKAWAMSFCFSPRFSRCVLIRVPKSCMFMAGAPQPVSASDFKQ